MTVKPTTLKPGEIKKRPLGIVAAEKQYVDAEVEIKKQKARQKEAGAAIEEYLDKACKDEYKRVERVTAQATEVLDQDKVKAFLGAKVKKYLKWTDPQPRLKVKASK
jgi:hypothetical protein